MLKRCVGVHKRCRNTDLMTSLQIRDPLESIKLRKLKLYQRLLANEITNEMLIRENANHNINAERKIFIGKIYNIVNQREKIETYDLELIVCGKINELNEKYENDQNKPDIIELKNYFEFNNLNVVEQMLTPNELKEWLDAAERETNERIVTINSMYQLQLDMESMASSP